MSVGGGRLYKLTRLPDCLSHSHWIREVCHLPRGPTVFGYLHPWHMIGKENLKLHECSNYLMWVKYIEITRLKTRNSPAHFMWVEPPGMFSASLQGDSQGTPQLGKAENVTACLLLSYKNPSNNFVCNKNKLQASPLRGPTRSFVLQTPSTSDCPAPLHVTAPQMHGAHPNLGALEHRVPSA